MRKYAQIGLAAWEFDAVCLLLLCGDHRPLFGPALLLTLVPVHNHAPPPVVGRGRDFLVGARLGPRVYVGCSARLVGEWTTLRR